MPKFQVALYTTLNYMVEVEAEDENEAAQVAWSNGGPRSRDLPPGFYIDESSWDVDWVEEA